MEGGEGEELGKCEGAFLSGQVKTPIPISSSFSSFKLCEYSIGALVTGCWAKSLDTFHGFAFGFILHLLEIMRLDSFHFVLWLPPSFPSFKLCEYKSLPEGDVKPPRLCPAHPGQGVVVLRALLLQSKQQRGED